MEAAHDRLGTRRRREAARGSPREHEFTADTSYKIDACLSAAAQAKKNRSHTKWGQNPNSPEIPACSAFRARTRCGDACDAWTRPPRASPRTIAALPRPRRRCGSAHASAGCPTRTIRLGTPRTPVGTNDTRRAATQC